MTDVVHGPPTRGSKLKVPPDATPGPHTCTFLAVGATSGVPSTWGFVISLPGLPLSPWRLPLALRLLRHPVSSPPSFGSSPAVPRASGPQPTSASPSPHRSSALNPPVNIRGHTRECGWRSNEPNALETQEGVINCLGESKRAFNLTIEAEKGS